jgi:hypothetical protein
LHLLGNRLMSTVSITAIMLAIILFFGFLLSSLATAQLQQQQQTTTTTTTALLSITTTPPLTPEEQREQNRLQNVIAATTRDLNETEKQVSGVVFTPRWSDVAWINANSISVLIAYCLPGEFADSGQEILGGFGLEVLESYAVDLPQGFMAWMAVVGNEGDDVQQNGRRLPAAVGVICASDLNNTDTRILSPQEQQEINNINQQFVTIQNTQITNIDQVINIINGVTGTSTTPPAQNETGGGGGGMTPPTTEGQPLRAEIIIANTTRAINNATNYKFDAGVTGGTPPYNYHWRWILPVEGLHEGSNRSFGAFLQLLGTHTILLNVTDSKNQTASDTLQITVGGPPTNDTGGTTTEGQPLTVEIIPNATSGFTLDRFELKTNVTGGIPPYFYDWDFDSMDLTSFACSYDAFFEGDNSCLMIFTNAQPLTHEVAVTVRDSVGKTASDTIQITVEERPEGGVLLPPETGQSPGGGLLPRTIPPSNDTGAASASATEPPLRVEAIANATQAVAPATIRFDANITGGAPPYSYSWSDSNLGLIDQDRSITLNFFEPGTFTYGLTVVDSRGKTVTDNVQIVISERVPQGGIVAPEPGGVAPPQEEGGLLPRTPPPPPPPPNDNEVISPPEGGGEEEPPTTTEEEGGEEPSAPPPPDDTGEEGGESPPDEEPTIPPG